MAEWNIYANFAGGHYGEHSSEIILNLGQWFRKIWLLKKKFSTSHVPCQTKTFGSGDQKYIYIYLI